MADALTVGALSNTDGARPPTRRVSRRRATGALSAGRDGSFWQRSKRPQLLLMSQIVGDLLRAHPKWEGSDGPEGSPLHIIDIGGSKGLLAQHLAERFGRRVTVTVIDIDARRIASGAARAARRGALPNLRFLAGDAAELSRDGALGDVDIVCGLHCCGGLSDLSIAHAVAHAAAFAVCTCCFLSNTKLELPASPQADMESPTNPLLSRDEWLLDSPGVCTPAGISTPVDGAADLNAIEPSQLRALLLAAEQQADPTSAALGAHSVNALRARAAERRWAERWQEGAAPRPARHRPGRLSVELLSFEPKFSPRNFVVVGRPE